MCLERSNEESTPMMFLLLLHDVIVYTVIKDMQSEYGQPRHFQKFKSLRFGPFTLKHYPTNTT